MTLPTALAAPVEEGMMLAPAPRPPRPADADKRVKMGQRWGLDARRMARLDSQSLLEGPSTVFWVAVVA